MSREFPITETFRRLRSEGRLAFMPFLTAGDPDTQSTARLLRELAGRGVDLIEVGFPYSDPIADGPVIQASYTRALQQGIHVNDIFAAVASVTRGEEAVRCPLVAMTAFSIIFRFGTADFLSRAKEAGFSGLIVPDLPGDEAADLFTAAQETGLDLVQLIAPTTPPERAARILQHASGFVYCVSVAGTTGVRETLPETLQQQLRQLRERTDLPLAVGFGISRPEQIEPLRQEADGVIVGSAIVRQMEALSAPDADREEIIRRIGDYAAGMTAAAHQTG